MIEPDNPMQETERLAELHKLQILDTEPEQRFDQLTALAQFTFGVEIVLISLVDAHRQWFKSRQGLKVLETPLSAAFSAYAINKSTTLVVSDSHQDARFADNPFVTGPPYIRFYAGAPLHSLNGHALGTLCLIDSQPRQFDEQAKTHLRTLADQVERELYYDKWRDPLEQQRIAQRDSVERERLLRTIIDNLPVNIYVKDLQHRKVLANKAEQQFLSVDNEDALLGLTDAELYCDDTEMLDVSNEEDTAVTVNGTAIINKEDYAITPDGNVTWFNVSKLPLLNANDEIVGLVGISVDITAEKKARDEKIRQMNAMRLLHEINAEPNIDLGLRINKALELGLQHLNMDIGLVSQIDGIAYDIRWLQSRAQVPEYDNQDWKREDTYSQLLLDNAGELIIEHVAVSPSANHPAYKKYRFECYMGTLLRVNGQAVGALSFYAREPKVVPFEDGDRLFLRLLGQWISAVLERSEVQEKMNELAEQVPGMLYQYRLWPNGRSAFVYASKGIEDIYLVSPEEALEDASVVFERIHPEDLASVSTSINISAQKLTRWECQYRVQNRNAGYQWVEGYATPKRSIDGSTIWHGYIHNIEDRKASEQMKSEFVSTVSHELRTPLTAIAGALKLLNAGVVGEIPEKAGQLIQMATRNSERLSLLINDLLDLEKLDAGQMKLSLEPVSVDAFATHCREVNLTYAEQFNVALNLAKGDKDGTLLADAHRLEQILSNLISNAIKFSPSNGKVTISYRISESDVVFSVEDNGPGIPADFHEAVFDRFTQADSSERRAKGGTGLGLAICKELAERMRGDIWFDTIEGSGTVFYVRFPLHVAIDDAVSSDTKK